MITLEQLAEFKELNAKLVCDTEAEKLLQEIATALANEVERLTAELALCHESAIDHTDDETYRRCEVEGCTANADYEGWYRVVDFSGNPTGLTQLREVCAEHAPMLIGWKE